MVGVLPTDCFQTPSHLHRHGQRQTQKREEKEERTYFKSLSSAFGRKSKPDSEAAIREQEPVTQGWIECFNKEGLRKKVAQKFKVFEATQKQRWEKNYKAIHTGAIEKLRPELPKMRVQENVKRRDFGENTRF